MSRHSPSGRKWQKFRQYVFANYGRTCHLCGHDGANTVDHLLTVLEYPQYAWVLANCRPAHGTGNRCPVCRRCCNQARVSGPKRPVEGAAPVAPRLSGTVARLAPQEQLQLYYQRRSSREW